METHSLIYKVATEKEEMDQINRLNYRTFVEEIPQHSTNEEKALVDRFHDENTYIIAKWGGEVVGMIALRSNRPYSLDSKIEDLDQFLPKDSSTCEIRLLSVKEEFRSTRVFFSLCDQLVTHCLERGYDMALISGTVRQLKLYRRMGFIPFGERVGSGDAVYQPMYLTKASFESSTKAFIRMMERKNRVRELSFLPGPVPMRKEVTDAFKGATVSHRNNEFIECMSKVRLRLKELVNVNHVQVSVGTGTLSNDMVAAHLSVLPGPGLILSNGEFGYRLQDHADRFGLEYMTISKEWGVPVRAEEVEEILKQNRDIQWIWTVHCETSTGFVYDVERLCDLSDRYDVKLCIDACSSVGVIPSDLGRAYLATSVSGKGIGAYPGLAIVFHREAIGPDSRIPRYLDIGQYDKNASIPYTHSSNLVQALYTALGAVDTASRPMIMEILRHRLIEAGFHVIGDEDYSPGIITVALPPDIPSREFGDRCRRAGLILSYESDYLLKRNWIQLALMGNYQESEVNEALDRIKTCMDAYRREFATHG